MKKTVTAGRDAREDIVIEIAPNEAGGTEIEIESTVETLYEKRIRERIASCLETLGLKDVKVHAGDRGALDWVIMARVEAAAKRIAPGLEKQCAPEMGEAIPACADKDGMRRSGLYLPGNRPDLMLNAGLFRPDGVILDLADSVALSEKDMARILVRNALCAVDFLGAERMVRINQLPAGFADLPFVVPYNVHTILVPRCEGAQDVRLAAEHIADIKDQYGIDAPTHIMPILATALGVVNAFEIAGAVPEVAALAFDAEDFTRDVGARQTGEGRESFVARCRIVLAARAAGVQPIDTVYMDVENKEGLLDSTKESAALGFAGRGCIHPGQIETIHEAFRPPEQEVRYALKVEAAMKEAELKGSGVVGIGSRMIDPTAAARALKILDLAKVYGIDAASLEEE